MAKRPNQIRFGTKAQQKVAQWLGRAGESVQRSEGSRGPSDLTAKFGQKQWLIEVKATRRGDAASPSSKDRQRLNQSATNQNATPVIAKVTPEGTTFESARDGRKMNP